ncbi:MAG: hypothetical protein JNL01_07360 [Bdellovibrionales bacterium]|nr:hypothetical protein [Bdellovibrionales bacterium]
MKFQVRSFFVSLATLSVAVFSAYTVSAPAFAEEKFAPVANPKATFAVEYTDEIASQEQIAKFTKDSIDWVKSKRSPAAAAGSPSESLISKEFKGYRDRYLGAKKTSELVDLIDDLNTNYSKLKENDTKFFAARMLMIKSLGGVIWKMIPLIEKTRMAQEVAAGMLRGMYEQLDIRFPDAQNKVVFEYMTQPQAGDTEQFKTVSDIQDKLVMAKLYPAIISSIKKLEAIDLKKEPIVFDTALRFGDEEATITQSHHRYKWVGEAERFAMLARLHRRASNLLLFTAYDLNDFIPFRQTIAKKLGFDVVKGEVTGADIAGLDRKTRTAIAKRYSFPLDSAVVSVKKIKVPAGFPNPTPFGPAWVTLPFWVDGASKVVFGEQQSKAAYQHLSAAVTYGQSAFDAMVAESKDEGALSVIDPALFAGRKDQIKDALKTMRAMIPEVVAKDTATKAPYTLHDLSGGRKIVVDVKGFYYHPPRNLTELFPTQFDAGAGKSDKGGWVTVKVDGKETQYRDYSKGRAIGWNKAVYAKLFPGLPSGDQVDDYQRILLRTCGARFLTSGLFGFVK